MLCLFPNDPSCGIANIRLFLKSAKLFHVFFVLFFSLLFILSSAGGVFSEDDTFNISAILLLLQLRI